MTTAAITPYRSDLRAGRDGFAQVLHAEWTKFRTVRGWVIGMLAAVLLTVLVGLLGPAGSSISCIGPTGKPCTPPVPPLGPDGQPVTDSFYFVHRPLVADGSITARVTSLTGLYSAGDAAPGGTDAGRMRSGTQPWSKAGIIIKQSTSQGSAYAAMMVTGSHGVRMQYNYTHDTAGLPGAVSAASPRWLRLTRTGDTITGYQSADGSQWTTVGTARLPGLSSTVQAGLFATSPDYLVTTRSFGYSGSRGGPSRATGVFDRISLRGSGPGGTWTGDNIPYQIGTDPLNTAGFQQSGDSVTVTGSGDVAPKVPGVEPIRTITDSLVGAYAALIAVIVVGTIFITAEFRRGLIRTTLAANPRRGRVLAAKAIVIGSVTFVAGLAAALATVPLVGQLARSKGVYLYPAPSLTVLRVTVGTAALLAVAAVLALGIGTVLRRSAAAVTAVIVLIVLPYLLAVGSVLPLGPAEWLLRATPAAAFAIQQSAPRYPQVIGSYTPELGYFPLAPWAGFAVLCGYAAVALGLAFVLLRRRDA
jgi:ABC-type transport system involved in multi-copper enzyme maturation permease subunit